MSDQQTRRIRQMKKSIRILLFGWVATCLLGSASGAAPTAAPLAPYQGLFRAPTRTALDTQGNLYVTDSRAGQVVKLG
ncbi:MAG: hypothetical protein WCG36_02825, partial [bacterium]